MSILASAALFAAFAGGAAPDGTALSAGDIIQRMTDANRTRFAALRSYTSTRRYRLVNQRFHKTAEITVQMTYSWPNRKSFAIVAESGPAIIRKRVLKRMLNAELEATDQAEKTTISAENYDFSLEGSGACENRRCFILAATPRRNNKFLFRGRIWVDQEDFAVVRVEAEPAKNPSFWTRNTRIEQVNAKFGRFWLPVLNDSRSDAFIFGPTEVRIEYSDYRIPDSTSASDGAPQAPQSKAARPAANLAANP